MRAIGMKMGRQCGDRHGAFTLSIKLRQFGAKPFQARTAIGHIHGTTAIEDRFQVRCVPVHRIVE